MLLMAIHGRWFRPLLIALSLLPLCAIAQEATQSIERVPDGELKAPFRIERVAGDLRVPWGSAFCPMGESFSPNASAGFASIAKNGKLIETPALTIDVAQGNKMGMLGIAQDPDFKKNGFIYIAYDYRITPAAGDASPPFRMRIVRYKLDDDNKLVEPKVLIEDIPASVNHTGCRLVFGPDGKLYITTGDADRPPASQQLNSLAGKILRLNSDGSVPKDNPSSARRARVRRSRSYGHRNPQGLAFEPGTNRLLDTEHGPGGGDEINWVEKGANYGWPTIDHARAAGGNGFPSVRVHAVCRSR